MKTSSWIGIFPRSRLILGLVVLAVSSPLSAVPSLSPWSQRETPGPRTEAVDLGAYRHVLHVRPDGGKAGARGGRSDPFGSVGAALDAIRDAAENRRYAILVAGGRYAVSNLRMKEHVDLLGGFDGRNWSRDIFAQATILDGQKAGPVVHGANHARLDGFAITGGRHRGHGGAIVCDHASPEISNNFIYGNATLTPKDFHHDLPYQRGSDGGGIALMTGCNSLVRNNVIADNTTEVGVGGGIVVWNYSKPRIHDNVISNNRTGLAERAERKAASRSSGGGGIAVNFYCKPEIAHNVVVLNAAGGTSDAGGIYLEHEATALVRGNRIVGNYADDDGGGMYVMKTSEPTLEGNIIAGNRNNGGSSGGIRLSVEGRMRAMNNYIVANSSGVTVTESYLIFQHNLVADNAPEGGIMYNNFLEHMRPPTLQDNIIWGNAPVQISIRQIAAGEPHVHRNVVQGGASGKANVAVDPKIIDDSLRGRVVSRRYDPAWATTEFVIDGFSISPIPDLAGRVIRLGEQWSVIKSAGNGRAVVWGELTDRAGEVFILGTYQLAADSPGRDKGPQFSAQ